MENVVNRRIPVCSNTTGWPIIGYACNEQQARRVVKKNIGDHSKRGTRKRFHALQSFVRGRLK